MGDLEQMRTMRQRIERLEQAVREIKVSMNAPIVVHCGQCGAQLAVMARARVEGEEDVTVSAHTC